MLVSEVDRILPRTMEIGPLAMLVKKDKLQRLVLQGKKGVWLQRIWLKGVPEAPAEGEGALEKSSEKQGKATSVEIGEASAAAAAAEEAAPEDPTERYRLMVLAYLRVLGRPVNVQKRELMKNAFDRKKPVGVKTLLIFQDARFIVTRDERNVPWVAAAAADQQQLLPPSDSADAAGGAEQPRRREKRARAGDLSADAGAARGAPARRGNAEEVEAHIVKVMEFLRTMGRPTKVHAINRDLPCPPGFQKLHLLVKNDARFVMITHGKKNQTLWLAGVPAAPEE